MRTLFQRSLRPWASAWLVACAFGVPQPLGAQIDPDEGLPVVPWEDARQVVGQVALVTGKIVRTGQGGRVHFLNFARHDRSAFTVVIFEESLAKFPQSLEDLYQGKLVVVRGPVTLFAGNPQIVVGSPGQIRIVEALPESSMPESVVVSTGEDITIATYNVENLFDDVDDPYTSDETTPAKSRDELERLGNVIRGLNADVLALQEVESRGYLQRFLDVMLPDLGYQHIVHYEGNDLRGIDVCLVSRIPVGGVTSNRHLSFPGADGQPQRFHRDLLCVELRPADGDPFEVWVVHLKSNSGGREAAEPIRLAEAREVRRLVERRISADPDAQFVICGDFNDTLDSATLLTIMGNEAPLLKAFVEHLPADGRITYNQEPYLSMIDFMLCSPAMARRYIPASCSIRLGTKEDSGTDHNPVSLQIRKRFREATVVNQDVNGVRLAHQQTGEGPPAADDNVPISGEPDRSEVAADESVGRTGLAAIAIGVGLTLVALVIALLTLANRSRRVEI